MIVIERKRNSGKTTILLHYMVCEPLAVYVTSTEAYAKRAFEKAQGLGLNLHKSRFKGMSDRDLKTLYGHGYKILFDDVDCACREHTQLGYTVSSIASIVTVNNGENNG